MFGHNKDKSAVAVDPIDTNDLDSADIRASRLSELDRHVPRIDKSFQPTSSGVVRPREAQEAQNRALATLAEQHEQTMQAGQAAEEAGQLALAGANMPEQATDVQHQLHG